MRPFSIKKSTKIVPKIDLERHRFFDRFWHRFFIDLGSIWGPILRPCWPLFRAQNGPPSRYSPLCLHVGSMLSLLAPFLTFLAPSWPHFDSISEDLKSILQVFRCHFAFDFYLSAKGSAEWVSGHCASVHTLPQLSAQAGFGFLVRPFPKIW